MITGPGACWELCGEGSGHPQPCFLSECCNFVSVRVMAKLLGQMPQESWHKHSPNLSISTSWSPTS